MNFFVTFILILLFTFPFACANDRGLVWDESNGKVSLKLKGDTIILKHEKKTYTFPSPQEDTYEGIRKVLRDDVDGDGEKEYIIGAQLPPGNVSYCISLIIIAKQKGRALETQHLISTGDWYGDIKLFDITKDGIMDLIIEGQGLGSAHYLTLNIVSCQKDKYVTLWDTGSACGVFFEVDEKGNAQVKIGIPPIDTTNWCEADEPDWEIWTWNGKKFVYTKGKTKKSRLYEGEQK